MADAAWPYPPGIDDAKTPFDCALAYAAAGFRVFPVDDNKKPHIKGWPAQSRRSTAAMPRADVGWVISTDIAVVDLDVKRGGRGIEDFVKLAGMNPLDVATPTARTASGGLHL
jgi:hypothetical protein